MANEGSHIYRDPHSPVLTPLEKTNMTLRNQEFEDVPFSHVSFQGEEKNLPSYNNR